jgi:hypothetical protein
LGPIDLWLTAAIASNQPWNDRGITWLRPRQCPVSVLNSFSRTVLCTIATVTAILPTPLYVLNFTCVKGPLNPRFPCMAGLLGQEPGLTVYRLLVSYPKRLLVALLGRLLGSDPREGRHSLRSCVKVASLGS